MAIKLKEHENSTTQALTEVALALSMAFFALLILALISMGVPAELKQVSELAKAKTIAVTKENTDKEKQTKGKALKYVIYYHGLFYDTDLNSIKANSFNPQDKLILAIESNLPISKVITLKTQINSSNLSITTLNEQWLSRLEEI